MIKILRLIYCSATLLLFSVIKITAACTATLPFAENFDAVVAWTTGSTLVTQTCNWSTASGGTSPDANDIWHRDDYTTGWSSGGAGMYAPASVSGSYSARFHNDYAQSGSWGDLISPQLTFVSAGTKTLTFQYINPDPSATMDVFLSTDGGATWGISLLHLTSANSWTLETVSLGASVSTTCMVKFRVNASYVSNDIGIDDVSISVPGATSTLSSSNPAVGAGNIAQGSTLNGIYSFSTAITTANMTLNSVTFTTGGGTYTTADITQFQLWYSTTNSFASAAQLGGNITTSLGNGTHTFAGLTQVINSGTTGYFWITADATAGATVGHTVIVSAITNANLVFAAGTSTGTAYAGGTQTIIAPPCTATLPFTQNFDAVWTTASTLLNGACAWSSSYAGTGNNSNDQWQRDDDATGWSSAASGVYTPVYTSASHSARFHNYYAPSGTTGSLITPQINMSPAGTKTLTFQYTNADNSTLDVYLSTDGGNTYGATLGTFSTTSGWTLETISLGAVVSTTTVLKFVATSNYGSYDIGIDDVSISAPPAGPPSIQATAQTFSGVDCQSMTITCTVGNGTGRYFVMNSNNTSWVAPTNGTPPASANTVWANSGLQVLASGTGNSVTVTGLTAGTTYYFRVYEYNGSGTSISYSVAAGGGLNPTSQAAAAIVAAPTLSASAINFSGTTCSQTTVSWTNGNGTGRIVVAKAGSAVAGTPVNASGYVANTSFSSGSAIAAGEYVVYSGTASSVTVTSLSSATTYYFKVFEDDGSTGCESYKTAAPPSSSVTTSSCATQIPYMTSAVINACPGVCGSEGANELLFFSSGSYAIPVNPANMILTYGSNPAPTKVYNGSFTADATITAKLNAAAGCAGFFIDASAAGTIPANTNFIFTSDNYCDGAYDFTSLCASGYGPVYMIYVNAAAWVQVPGSPSGNYANAAGTGVPRYFRTDFSAVTGGGTTGITDYSYISSSLACDCDGATCTWGPAGGAPAVYIMPNSCTFPMLVLPIELASFTGTRNGKSVKLDWVTQTETNNAYFNLERSTNGTDFDFVAQIKGAGNSSSTLRYAYIDDGAPAGICYYRLKQTDINGNFTRSHDITVKPLHFFTVQSVYPNPATQQLNVSIEQESSNNMVVSVYNSEGKRVYMAAKTIADKSSTLQIDLGDFPAGIYLLTVKGSDTDYQSKFIKQ